MNRVWFTCLQNAYKWTIFYDNIGLGTSSAEYKGSLNFFTCYQINIWVSLFLFSSLLMEYWFYKMWSLCHPGDGVIVTLYVILTIASTLACQVTWFSYRERSVLCSGLTFLITPQIITNTSGDHLNFQDCKDF